MLFGNKDFVFFAREKNFLLPVYRDSISFKSVQATCIKCIMPVPMGMLEVLKEWKK
jgi:hypothetical protein